MADLLPRRLHFPPSARVMRALRGVDVVVCHGAGGGEPRSEIVESPPCIDRSLEHMVDDSHHTNPR